ncbi:hypothetical protein D3H34_04770 [Acidovorax cavernicola]|uniref:Uncharacterized protein n=1 Tax=Acidovorax cavernicola TaxID=1675792 RepID=A0A9X8D7W7_9BURK|nr:hypothetical protein D3H34_04770 [Acidovorax cavernicola]
MDESGNLTIMIKGRLINAALMSKDRARVDFKVIAKNLSGENDWHLVNNLDLLARGESIETSVRINRLSGAISIEQDAFFTTHRTTIGAEGTCAKQSTTRKF